MEGTKTTALLIDEDAITYMEKNKENYDKQLQCFVDTNKSVWGVGLANGKDFSVIRNSKGETRILR